MPALRKVAPLAAILLKQALVSSIHSFQLKNLNAIFYLILLSSCALTEKPNSNFKAMLNEQGFTKCSDLNYAGAYQVNANSLEMAVFFFENRLMYYEVGRITDTASYEKHLYKYLVKNPNWGVYEVHEDTITAHVYSDFNNIKSIGHWYITKFQGIISNKDTILDWHIVEPYPRFSKNVDKEYAKNKIAVHTNLNFKKVSFRSIFDSVAIGNVWINKYRK